MVRIDFERLQIAQHGRKGTCNHSPPTSLADMAIGRCQGLSAAPIGRLVSELHLSCLCMLPFWPNFDATLDALMHYPQYLSD